MQHLSRITSRGIILILILLIAGAVSAREILDGERCHIPQETVIQGDLFALCGDLVIEGNVEGHIIGAARTATISGHIGGSIYLLAGELRMNGTLGKDVHFIGLTMQIEESTVFEHERGAILSANLSNTIQAGATIPGNISDVGYQLIIEGDVGREINFWGSTLTIEGQVGGDVTATVGDSESNGTASQIETLLLPLQFDINLRDPGLILTENASVQGSLKYTGPTPGIIRGTTHEEVVYHSTRPPIPGIAGTTVEESARTVGQYIAKGLNEFISLFSVAAICLLAIPRQIQAPIKEIQARPISTLGVGLLGFILSFPIVLLLCIMSLVFIFLLTHLPIDDVTLFSGIVLGLANIGAASVFYFTAIYITRVVVALAIGRVIVRVLHLRVAEGHLRSQFASVAIGLLALSMLGAMPVVGRIFTAIVLFLGLGGILRSMGGQIRRMRENISSTHLPPPIHYKTRRSPRLPYYPEDAIQFAPPLIDEPPDKIGTGDLPEGFDWWGEET